MMKHLQIDVLSDIVEAVNGRCEVYLDGGVRTGTDVLKAVALGARAVFVGRPALYGLAYKVHVSLYYTFTLDSNTNQQTQFYEKAKK